MTIKAHFDGKVFVPDEPVDIPAGEQVTLQVAAPTERRGATAADILARLQANPQIKETWDRIAAGRDSLEVARDLRRRASTRRPNE